MPTADVVILGEVHDNPLHHEFQAEVVDHLGPSAVVFEMFGPDGAGAVTGLARDDAAALAEALDWSESGWPDFAMYAPIFAASGDAVLFGGALPRNEVRRAVTEGAAAVFGDDAARFGLDEALPGDQQETREAGQMAAHCDALPEDLLAGMVEAQRLRDAALARVIAEALDQTGGPVVVITGNGHARRDWGIPVALAVARPDVTVISVGQFEAAPEGDPAFDLWRVTDPAEREDPCAVFR